VYEIEYSGVPSSITRRPANPTPEPSRDRGRKSEVRIRELEARRGLQEVVTIELRTYSLEKHQEAMFITLIRRGANGPVESAYRPTRRADRGGLWEYDRAYIIPVGGFPCQKP